MKLIEQALYDSKLPNIVPQRQDSRTIRIPIPKYVPVHPIDSQISQSLRPTVEARGALYTAAHRKAEEIRVQIRKQHQPSIKRGKYQKHSIELDEVSELLFLVLRSDLCQFQKLTDRYVGEVDKILASLKKATGAK